MIRLTRFTRWNSFNGTLPRRIGLAVLGVVSLGGCQSPTLESRSAQDAPHTPQAEPIAAVSQEPATPQDLLRSIPSWDAHATPGLPYTSPADRLSQAKVGRPDPFAPTETIVVNMDPQSLDSPAAKPSTTTASLPGAPLPLTPVAPIQTLPVTSLGDTSLPAPPSLASELPTVSIAPLSPSASSSSASSSAASPTHLADQMQVKGIVELNQQWQAIVWEPQSSVSKTVRAGDVIGNGQVKVRRIEQTSNGSLRLVLEQNGIEVIHTVS